MRWLPILLAVWATFSACAPASEIQQDPAASKLPTGSSVEAEQATVNLLARRDERARLAVEAAGENADKRRSAYLAYIAPP